MSHILTKAELDQMKKQQFENSINGLLESYCDKCRQNQKIESMKDMDRIQENVMNRILTSEFGVEEEKIPVFQDSAVSETEFHHKLEKTAQAIEFDLSALRNYQPVLVNEWKVKMKNLLQTLEKRVVISQSDARDRERILTGIMELWNDPDRTPEDKIQAAAMRISAYLANGIPVEKVDFQKIENERLEYLALCDLLGIEPKESLPERISILIPKLKKQALEEEERIYISQTLEELMNSLGCHLKSSAVLHRQEGQIFELEDNSPFDIFISDNMKNVVFEPVRKNPGAAADSASEQKVCSLYDRLKEEAAKKGILLKTIYQEPVETLPTARRLEVTEKKETSVRRRAARHKKVRKLEF